MSLTEGSARDRLDGRPAAAVGRPRRPAVVGLVASAAAWSIAAASLMAGCDLSPQPLPPVASGAASTGPSLSIEADAAPAQNEGSGSGEAGMAGTPVVDGGESTEVSDAASEGAADAQIDGAPDAQMEGAADAQVDDASDAQICAADAQIDGASNGDAAGQ